VPAQRGSDVVAGTIAAGLQEHVPADAQSGVTEAGAELVRVARSVGLVRGETVAVDGSKFRAVSSAKSIRERDAVKRYLEQLDAADAQDEVVIDSSAVQAALEKLKSDPEPEARFMRTANGFAPAYNVQTAVDTEHALIVAQKVTDEATDNRSLLPMAEAAKQAVGDPPSLNLVADAGYSNGEQAETCEAQGIVLHVPAQRAVNNQGDGTLFDRREFHYDEKTDTFRCPANKRSHANSCSGIRRESFTRVTPRCVARVL